MSREQENEWQPVRIKPNFMTIHTPDPGYEEIAREAQGKICRARLIEVSARMVQIARDHGCKANVFVQVHPEDVPKIFPSDERSYGPGRCVLCECAILAD